MKIPHRLANLCTTLVMQDKLEESRQHLSRAWLIKQGDHDITSARILFVRLAVAFLESQSAGHFIGQLKVLISGNTLGTKVNIVRVWDIDPFLANLRAKLVPEITDFLEALVRALNDRSQVSTLDDFGLWRNQSFVSLDAPWV
jgi:hypothetical protein